MLSDIHFRSLRFWTNWVGCFFGAVPFLFDKKRKQLYTNHRVQRRCLRVWSFLVIYNLLLIVTMWYMKKTKNFNAFNQAYSGWIISALWVIFMGHMALQPNRICLMYNSLLAFLNRYKALYIPDYNPNKCPVNRTIDLATAVTRWICLILAILETAHYRMFARESPFYIDYYIPEKYYTKLISILTLKFHFCVFMVTSINIGFVSVFSIATSFHFVFIISQDIRCGLRQKYRTLDVLRTGQHMRLTVRTLEIIQIIQLEMGSYLLYPMHWLFNKMILYCGANLIKYGHHMAPVVRYTIGGWTLLGLLLWGTALEVAGYMNLYSQRAITSWKYHDWGSDRRVMSKFKRSCRPMKIAYHKVFSIKRLSVLKFFRSIGKGMFKALVAL